MRFEELRNKKKPSPFISCFTSSPKEELIEQKKKSTELNDVFANWSIADQKPKVNTNANQPDIFDFLNNNQQQQSNTSVNNYPNSNENKPSFQFPEPSKDQINVNKPSFQFPESSKDQNFQVQENTNTNISQKAPDLNDLINSIYKNEYGLGINNNSNMNQINQPNMNMSAQPLQQGINAYPIKPNSNLDDLFDLSNQKNSNNPSK